MNNLNNFTDNKEKHVIEWTNTVTKIIYGFR